jgi:hypothetical protein
VALVKPLHAFSFGGGVQSTAALVLAAQGRLPATDDSNRWDVFIFANVGDRAEHPATIRYLEEYAKPYAAEHGIELIEIRRERRDGTAYDLYDQLLTSQRSIDIPVRLRSGAPANRSCTVSYKVRPIAKELRRLGARDEDGKRAIVGIGISLDEIQRAKHWGVVNPQLPIQIKEYPLLRLGVRRRDAYRIVEESGLPRPPRSACWFCPFHTRAEWARLRREEPDLFWKAVELERILAERRESLGRDRVWFTDFLRPLDEVVQDQLTFEDEHAGDGATCDTGACFT